MQCSATAAAPEQIAGVVHAEFAARHDVQAAEVVFATEFVGERDRGAGFADATESAFEQHAASVRFGGERLEHSHGGLAADFRERARSKLF